MMLWNPAAGTTLKEMIVAREGGAPMHSNLTSLNSFTSDIQPSLRAVG